MLFWRNSEKKADKPQERHGISLRALQGARNAELCDAALEAVRSGASGNVDRIGVWLAPEVANHAHANRDASMASFQGCVWDRRQDTPPEWESLLALQPLPDELLSRKVVVEKELNGNQAVMAASPLAGMRRAIWVPVRAEYQLVGVMFAVTHKVCGPLPREAMEACAAELGMVLSLHALRASMRHAQQDTAFAKRVWSDFAAAPSFDRSLQEIVRSAVDIAEGLQSIAPFAMIGLLPGKVFVQVSRDAPLEFSWIAGDKLWARAAMGEPVSAVWRGALQTGKTTGQEWKTSPVRGEIRRLVAVPLRVSGDVVGVLVAGLAQSGATLANVERLELRARLAEVALALSARNDAGSGTQDYARFFVDRAGEPLFLLNAKLEITRSSEAGEKLLSLVPPRSGAQQIRERDEKTTYGTAAQLFRPAEWQRLVGWMRDISRNSRAGAPHALETELRTGKPVRLHATCLPDASLVLFVQAAGEVLGAREHPSSVELRSLIEWLEQGVVLFDEQENIRTYNLRFAQLFGLSRDDLSAIPSLRELVNMIAPKVSDPSRFADRWWDASRGAEAMREEIQLMRPSPRILERFSRPMIDATGARTGRLEIYRDLSMQQLLQEKLRKNERLASVGERVSGIAHELSNPLTTILGYAQRLLARPEGHARRDDIHRIFSEAERASSILRQLLSSTRSDSSGLQPVSLNSLIQDSVDLNRFQLASDKIRVEFDLAPDLPAVLGDSGQLQQVLVNLIANSRHALLEQQSPRSISFRTRLADSGRVLLEVSDSGPGIPEALRHRVFDPFFTTKPEGVGTGLGLSIVAGLIRQHGGQIRLQAPQTRGATFLIDFPATAGSETGPEPMLVPESPAAFVAPPALALGMRVLVVEDEPTVAQLIADMLRDLGYVPEVQHDARRALISALNRDFALVVCDMKMPQLDGQHFYRALAEAGSPLIHKFLFVTGDILAPATQEFLRHHQLPHIAKPFRVEEFTKKITWVAGQPQVSSASPAAPSRQNLISHG